MSLAASSKLLIILILFESCGAVFFNFSCILDLCERFHIKNLQFHDLMQDNRFEQLLPAYFEEFSHSGIRISKEQLNKGNPIQNMSRNLHALNTAYLFLNIDPSNQLNSFSVQDDIGTSPSMFIFSFLAVRGGFTVDETLQHSLSLIEFKYDSRAYALFQSVPQNLYEVYKVSSSQKIITRPVGHISTNIRKALPMTDAKSSVTNNRNNLQAVKITVLVGTLSKNMEALDDDWTKAYILIWKHIAQTLNFTLKIKNFEKDLLPEASWSSMLDEIKNGAADVSLAPIIMLPSTTKKTEFLAPIHRVSFSVLMRATASERIRWTNFLLPFHPTLWICILTAILVLTSVLALFWKTEFEKHHNTNLSFIEIFSESFVCIHGAACMQGHPDPPMLFSSRAIHLSALISAVVVIATYSGSVTAFLTVRIDDQPFSNFDDLLKSTRFRPFVLEKSPESSFFEESVHPSMEKYRLKGPPSTVAKLTSALQIACNKNASLPAPWSKKIPVFLVATHWVDRILDMAPCVLSDFPLSMQTFWVAFPMKPKLPFKRILDNRIRRMFEGGSIHRFEVDIKKSAKMRREHKEALKNQRKNDNILSMNILDFAPLAALLAIGAGSALVILAFEYLVYHLW